MNKKQQAQYLYMDGKTHKEIADAVGISERTVFTWIHSLAWDKLRLAAWQGPATIANNLCSQLVELQNSIASREPGKRFPTPQEAEISRKLIVSLEKMKKYPSISQTMQVLETFRNYMRPVDKDFTRTLTNYTNRFLNGQSVNGFVPYQVEYGVNTIPPISSFYDEADNTDTRDMENPPCTDCNNCLHPGDCSYPKCKHPEWYAPKTNPAAAYNITPNREPAEQYSELCQTAKTGSDPAVLSSTETSKPKNQETELQGNAECTTHSTSPSPVMVNSPNRERAGVRLPSIADIMNLPPAERPSPYRDGNTLWVNHIDDADEYRDNFGRLWGERKIGDTVCRYPDVDTMRKRA